MTEQVREITQGLEMVEDFDKEQFLLKLGAAVGKWTNPDAPPQITFSHTEVGDQVHYAAIVIGRQSEGEVTVVDNLNRE